MSDEPKDVSALVDAATERLRRMTNEEFLQSLIDAGIYTKSGKLKKQYKENNDDDAAFDELST